MSEMYSPYKLDLLAFLTTETGLRGFCFTHSTYASDKVIFFNRYGFCHRKTPVYSDGHPYKAHDATLKYPSCGIHDMNKKEVLWHTV